MRNRVFRQGQNPVVMITTNETDSGKLQRELEQYNWRDLPAHSNHMADALYLSREHIVENKEGKKLPLKSLLERTIKKDKIMRSNVELLQILKEKIASIKDGPYGMCNAITALNTQGKISYEEKNKLKKLIEKYRPADAKSSYWWSTNDKVSRVLFLSDCAIKEMNQLMALSPEDVMAAIKVFPSTKPAFEKLFPQMFEDEKPFVRIGTIFFRKSHPKCIYALIESGGYVKLMNVTYSKLWKTAMFRKSELKDIEKNSMTKAEFKGMVSGSRFDDIVISKIQNYEQYESITSN